MADNTFLDTIKSGTIQDLIIEVRGHAGEMTIEVAPEHIFDVLKVMKEEYGFNYLSDISASDNYTDDQRFVLDYNIVNLEDRQRLRISCRIEEDKPEVESVIPIWGAANWFEREAFDMIGIRFKNHPDLRRMFMPEDFEYHPMRKEFPLLGIPGSIDLPPKAEKDYK